VLTESAATRYEAQARPVTRRARKNVGMHAELINHAFRKCASRRSSGTSPCRNTGETRIG
jgi:hypothetical protein